MIEVDLMKKKHTLLAILLVGVLLLTACGKSTDKVSNSEDKKQKQSKLGLVLYLVGIYGILLRKRDFLKNMM